MSVNGKKCVWWTSYPKFEASDLLGTWIKGLFKFLNNILCGRQKSWVKIQILWDWNLLKVTHCLKAEGFQKLLLVIRLAKWVAVAFADSAVLIHGVKATLQSRLVASQKPSPFFSALSQGTSNACQGKLTGSGQLLQGIEACSTEVIYVMHCHLLCLRSNYKMKRKPRKHGASKQIITACQSHCASGEDCTKEWKTNSYQGTKKYKWHVLLIKITRIAQWRRSHICSFWKNLIYIIMLTSDRLHI